MMRIAILTFQNVPNYGAMLQAYALKKYLENEYHANVNIIDYKCSGNSNEYNPEVLYNSFVSSNIAIKRIIKKCIYNHFTKEDYELKFEKFQNFRDKYLNLTEFNNGIYNEYDCIVFGSDQIWNPEITNGFDDVYLPVEKTKGKARTISYAASCGDIQTVDKSNRFIDSLRNFDAIGVRESSLCEYLKQKGIECIETVDPTFLLSREDYNELIKKVKNNSRDYLIVYNLTLDKELDIVANQVAKKRNLRIIKVYNSQKYTFYGNNEIFDAGVEDFVSLVCNASYVVTNSFHGTALSIIFGKDFNVVLPQSRTNRIKDMLIKLRLQSRIANREEIHMEHIEYNEIYKFLHEELHKSKEFIKREIITI